MIRMLYPEYEDPVWLRVGATLLFLTIVALTYVSRWVRSNIVRICRGSVWFLTAWLVLLCSINDFMPDLVVGLIVTINVSAAGIILDLHRSRPLVSYLLFTTGIIVVGLVTTPDPQVWVVHFVGLLLINMFVIYLTAEGRLTIWRQRRQLEERYGAFAATVTEGFFQFVLEKPLTLGRSTPQEMFEHILVHSRLSECNLELCRILGIQHPEEVLGASMQTVFGDDVEAAIHRFVEGGFRLTGWNHSRASAKGQVRHFVVNAVSTREDSKLTSVVGSCVEVTEQVERERRMVALLEKHEGRVGRDLHDETGQILTSLRMLSTSLARRYFEESDEGYEQARQVAELAREAHSSVQRIYRHLIPRRLETETLREALEALALQAKAIPGVTVHFAGDEGLRFRDPEVKLQLYRIAQEALANAIKHAEASEVAIGLHRQDGDVVLEVCDNGQGFDVSAAVESTEAIGLYSMRYRAHSINAGLEIDSTPGAGTRVRCALPTSTCEGARAVVPC